ncbi:hypothetical protein V5799_009938 [Amblyomma americanum]|uniref:Uncharacterized protein n=1 Tax=Amblyomma americanum TaxID=6943 RepID=A0AAQ4F916_AMBAM
MRGTKVIVRESCPSHNLCPRASVPRDAVGGFRSGGHRHKPHSRSTGSEGRSQSQPVAGMAVRLGAQSRTPLGQGAEAAQRRRHNAAAAAKPATTQSAEASYDFSRYHQANQREQKGHSIFGGGRPPQEVESNTNAQRYPDKNDARQDRGNQSPPAHVGSPVEYDISEKLILEDIEKEYSIT